METIHVSHEPGGILTLTFQGEVNDMTDINALKADIAVVSKSVRELHDTQKKGIKVIIDITDFTAQYVSEAADALVELAREDKALVEKTAVFGGSFEIRMMGETIVALSGRKNIQFFKTKAEALLWLQA